MTAADCVYGDGWAADAVLVGYVPGASGPGWAQYAHPECARAHGRTPIGGERDQQPSESSADG